MGHGTEIPRRVVTARIREIIRNTDGDYVRLDSDESEEVPALLKIRPEICNTPPVWLIGKDAECIIKEYKPSVHHITRPPELVGWSHTDPEGGARTAAGNYHRKGVRK